MSSTPAAAHLVRGGASSCLALAATATLYPGPMPDLSNGCPGAPTHIDAPYNVEFAHVNFLVVDSSLAGDHVGKFAAATQCPKVRWGTRTMPRRMPHEPCQRVCHVCHTSRHAGRSLHGCPPPCLTTLARATASGVIVCDGQSYFADVHGELRCHAGWRARTVGDGLW